MSEDEPLFSEFEFYSYENPEVPLEGEEALTMKLDHVLHTCAILKKLEQSLIHPNHYALLPTKTAILATVLAIIEQVSENKEDLLKHYMSYTKELLQVADVLMPGYTRHRGEYT